MINSRFSYRNATLQAVRPYTIIQGEVLYAFNLAQDAFFNVFLAALSLERPDNRGAFMRFQDHALAIWHTSQSDKQQRQMALEAISTVPTKLKIHPLIARLEWAKKRTDKLAEYRNLIVHNPVTFKYRQRGRIIEAIPDFGGASTRAIHQARLASIKGTRFWASLRDDFLKLGEYVDFLTRRILMLDYDQKNGPVPGLIKTLPGRPRLRSPRLIHAVENSLTKATPAPKRRKPRRSSAE